MHHSGSSSSRMMDGASGSRDHGGQHYPASSSSVHQSQSPMHLGRQIQPNTASSRLQSPSQGGGYGHRHAGHPMTPVHLPHPQPLPPPPPLQTLTAHQQQPRAVSPSQASTPGSAMSQPLTLPPPPHRHASHAQGSQQPPIRYYPPLGGQTGSGPAHGVPHQSQQQQHGHSQRQNAPHGMGMGMAQQASQTPSPRAMPIGAQFGRFKGKLQQRVPLHGVWLSIPSPVTARMLAAQGFDWACIDMEHAPTNPALMAEMVAAVASSGTCAPIVRVPSHSPEWFKWALDAGAYGIIIPMVNTPDEMRRVEQLCRYPPVGRRSMGAFFAPHAFGLRGPRAMADYVEHVSGDIVVIPQIESVEGVMNLPAILKAGGMDAIFVGPYDLSASVRTTQEM
ncbi:hypothetical protein EV175_006432, partial [Coemansia sp. RSA 1933]